MGRQPAVKPLPYGNYSIIDFDTGGRSMPARYSSGVQLCSEGNGSMSSTNTSGSRSKAWYSRSLRLATAEPVLVRTSLSAMQPSRGHQHIRHMLETTEGFIEAHRHFMLGKSFTIDFQVTVRLLFSHSPQLMVDAYSGALELMKQRKTQIKERSDPDLTIGSSCLRSLRVASMSIKHMQDATVVIMLGQIMAVYNILIPCPSTHTIVRSTLLSVKEWYPSLLQQPEMDSVTLTPVLVDTIECLVRRDMPIIRIPHTNRCIVDRCIGICASLLTLFYDLCEISYQVKMRDHAVAAAQWDDPYAEIEEKICAWTPVLPPHFFSQYSSTEVTTMLTQARLYRITALLVIHRLRFPVGIEDTTARSYAESILNELRMVVAWQPDEFLGLAVDFPLLAAMVEMPVCGEEILRVVEPRRLRKAPTEEILKFVRHVRKSYEMGYGGLWLDLTSDELLGVILP
ncbi:hypothetical protein UA08_04824 [Talaromyces atroroseus]|uniref:Zn(II)2Cys6 transcription factor n=1 Tax=Talaromyces atroroseus TaxID=1441469 RepID=A0A225AWG9_TALAT|nr:hypothetical protein UA08_04824 [Talaromyces atroroseus]OKL59959.1 hypothetical protein UA08_04824 [Talaromyces atroroseus]